MTSREVSQGLDEAGVQVALTTVITALQRLTAKGLLRREPGPRARSWVFEAVRDDAADAADRMTKMLGSVADRDEALLRFAGSLEDDDIATLRRVLERGR